MGSFFRTEKEGFEGYPNSANPLFMRVRDIIISEKSSKVSTFQKRNRSTFSSPQKEGMQNGFFIVEFFLFIRIVINCHHQRVYPVFPYRGRDLLFFEPTVLGLGFFCNHRFNLTQKTGKFLKQYLANDFPVRPFIVMNQSMS